MSRPTATSSRPEVGDERPADPVGDLRRQFVRNDPADVVGLEQPRRLRVDNRISSRVGHPIPFHCYGTASSHVAPPMVARPVPPGKGIGTAMSAHPGGPAPAMPVGIRCVWHGWDRLIPTDHAALRRDVFPGIATGTGGTPTHVNTRLNGNHPTAPVLGPHDAVDLHLHTLASDGFWKPSELIDYLAEKRITVAAVCDHDTQRSVIEAIQLGQERGVHIIPGVEVTTTWRDRQWHLLVYGIHPERRDPDATAFQAALTELDAILQNRAVDARRRIEASGRALPSLGEILAGRPMWPFHVLSAAIQDKHVPSLKESAELVVELGGNFTADLPIGDVIVAAHEAGGICVMAHPGRSRFRRDHDRSRPRSDAGRYPARRPGGALPVIHRRPDRPLPGDGPETRPAHLLRLRLPRPGQTGRPPALACRLVPRSARPTRCHRRTERRARLAPWRRL